MTQLLSNFKLPTGFEFEMNVPVDESHGYVNLLRSNATVEVHFRLKLEGHDEASILEMLPCLNGSVVSRRMRVGLLDQIKEVDGVELGSIYFFEKLGMTSARISASGPSSGGEIVSFSHSKDLPEG